MSAKYYANTLTARGYTRQYSLPATKKSTKVLWLVLTLLVLVCSTIFLTLLTHWGYDILLLLGKFLS